MKARAKAEEVVSPRVHLVASGTLLMRDMRERWNGGTGWKSGYRICEWEIGGQLGDVKDRNEPLIVMVGIRFI